MGGGAQLIMGLPVEVLPIVVYPLDPAPALMARVPDQAINVRVRPWPQSWTGRGPSNIFG